MTQALVVTAGPFAGRICENDDDEFLFENQLSNAERAWFTQCGVEWRTLEVDPDDDDQDEFPERLGVDCEVVTFGFYLQSSGHYFIPRQFLRPANMKDLVSRMSEISERITKFSLLKKGFKSYKEAFNSILEYNYIVEEIWHRENMAKEIDTHPQKLFLCHASQDKYFVRQVRNDLADAGHSTWMDEFEIQVGDSIVDKINSATESTDGILLFISNASNASAWAKKEWQSALAKYLRLGRPKIYPIRIEDCEVPSIIADIRYADFADSYKDGLESLLVSLRIAGNDAAKERGVK